MFRTEGFHLLIGFLVSVGCLMEGCGIEAARTHTQTPVVVNRLVYGKEFGKAIRRVTLCSNALYFLYSFIFGKISQARNCIAKCCPSHIWYTKEKMMRHPWQSCSSLKIVLKICHPDPLSQDFRLTKWTT